MVKIKIRGKKCAVYSKYIPFGIDSTLHMFDNCRTELMYNLLINPHFIMITIMLVPDTNGLLQSAEKQNWAAFLLLGSGICCFAYYRRFYN